MQTWLCPTLWDRLKEIDYKLALKAKSAGCPHCQGVLDWASFARKPRGIEQTEVRRFSLCCRQCRKRVTPRSTRFLWKKVYVLLAVVVGPEKGLMGVGLRTVGRWRQYWQEHLSCQSLFYVHFRYLLPVDFASNLHSMISSFSDWIAMAQFVSPLGCSPHLRFEHFRAEDAPCP